MRLDIFSSLIQGIITQYINTANERYFLKTLSRKFFVEFKCLGQHGRNKALFSDSFHDTDLADLERLTVCMTLR